MSDKLKSVSERKPFIPRPFVPQPGSLIARIDEMIERAVLKRKQEIVAEVAAQIEREASHDGQD
jgi:hypothetical protein